MQCMVRPRTTKVYVTVSAENGYDDHIYTFNIMRSAPVNNNLAELDFGLLRTVVNTDIPVPAITSGRGNVERVASVPATTGPGSTMSVFIKARMQEGQMGMVATVDGTEVFPMSSITGENDRIHRVYRITGVPRTGDIETVVFLTVTSEDDIDKTYEITLNRGGAPTPTATLTALSVSGVTLNFASTTTSYTASVANGVTSTTVAATASTGATATITPADADAGTAGHQVNLAEGANPISIAVTGGGMTPTTYTVTVTRAEASTPAEPGLTLNPTELVIAEGGAGTYTMVLDKEPTADVTVTLSDDGTDVSVGGSPATFTTTNWASPQTVTVFAADDGNSEDETVTITHTIAGAAEYAALDPELLEVTVSDNDKSAGLTLSTTSLTIDEGDDEGMTYTVVLDAAPTGAVTVAVSVQEEDAQGVTVDPASLSFDADNWETAQEVTVKAGHDDDAAPGTVTLIHTVTAYGRTTVATEQVTVTVNDDDVAGLNVTASAVEIAEGSSVSYDVQLATEPSANVTVTVGGASGDVSVNPSQFTFTVGNWDRVQTVMVSAGADADTDVDPVVELTHSATGASEYSSASLPGVSVTVKEAAIAAVVVSRTALTVVEGSVGEVYRLTLTQAPVAGETVTVTVGSPADISTSTTSASLDASNWSTGVMVRVTSPDDGATEDDQTQNGKPHGRQLWRNCTSVQGRKGGH